MSFGKSSKRKNVESSKGGNETDEERMQILSSETSSQTEREVRQVSASDEFGMIEHWSDGVSSQHDLEE
jgi:hypothetical protein